ncbi:MAG: class I SAM-dependent methyltransferase [Oligoflexus sp.]
MSQLESVIHEQVAAMYQRFPYPAYPLGFRLQWWQAYLGSMAFAQALVPQNIAVSETVRILLAGCGDTQPYIHRKLEPRQHHLVACDIAQRNLQRARWRLLLEPKQVEWWNTDLLHLPTNHEGFSHIDCYGVLHHLANPRQGLISLSHQLRPGATMRLMVYNRQSRDWIWHMRQVFRLLRLDYQSPADLRFAQDSLKTLANYHSGLKQQLENMGLSWQQASRFVDTFFHVREARITLSDWLTTIEQAGLKIVGQLDRYAELDDLPNPLWKTPSLFQLEQKISEHQFAHNFEWYLCKPAPKAAADGKQKPLKGSKILWQSLHSAPRLWRQYPETQCISRIALQRLWWCHGQYIYRQSTTQVDHILQDLPTAAVQRLARIGAFFPRQLQSKKLFQLAMAPMDDPLVSLPVVRLRQNHPLLLQEIERLVGKRRRHEQLVRLIFRHLEKIPEAEEN